MNCGSCGVDVPIERVGEHVCGVVEEQVPARPPFDREDVDRLVQVGSLVTSGLASVARALDKTALALAGRASGGPTVSVADGGYARQVISWFDGGPVDSPIVFNPPRHDPPAVDNDDDGEAT